MDLTQAKHAFITGGASGIGLGIADALVKRGVPVTIADVDADSIQAVVAERKGRLRGQVLDVRDRAAWIVAKAEAEAALGPVDILVANAGIGSEGKELSDSDPECFDRIMAINVGGIFNAISAFGSDLRARRRGHVVITGSVAGLAVPNIPRLGSYAAAKSAVVALGEALRPEMAAYDVGVSTLCPGMVASNLGRNTARMGGRPKPLTIETRGGGPVYGPPMDPAEVGEITVRGIERNDTYIITHPQEWTEVEGRWHALQAAFTEG
jgi:NAD(P)-dependent dehydrogenase (short-subunit alcohol dehydrogenase family)